MKKGKTSSSQKFLIPTIMIVLFFTGLSLGMLIKTLYPETITSVNQLREGGYEFINPLVDFETVEAAGKYELNQLDKKLHDYIDKLNPEIDNVNTVSVYYKDLNSGAWVGIKEDEKFEPASLLKVGVMITSYKIAEVKPEHLDQKLRYQMADKEYEEREITIQNVEVEKKLTVGQEYTLDEYINQLITYSDNSVIGEIYQLTSETHKDPFDDIFPELGLQTPGTTETFDFISTKEYASFFRILYNATYLNKEHSSKALELLTKTTYSKGLRAGVPRDVKIAKKFGERAYFEKGITQKVFQLHDCGIIYHPTKPYILCVMTRGKTLTNLEDVIKNISTITYQAVDNQ